MGTSRSLDTREPVARWWMRGCRATRRRDDVRGYQRQVQVGIVQLERPAGGLAPASQGRPRRSRLDAVSDWLKAQAERHPDITMPELAQAFWAEHDLTAIPANAVAPSDPSP